jgi:hypothetical protein
MLRTALAMAKLTPLVPDALHPNVVANVTSLGLVKSVTGKTLAPGKAIAVATVRPREYGPCVAVSVMMDTLERSVARWSVLLRIVTHAASQAASRATAHVLVMTDLRAILANWSLARMTQTAIIKEMLMVHDPTALVSATRASKGTLVKTRSAPGRPIAPGRELPREPSCLLAATSSPRQN